MTEHDPGEGGLDGAVGNQTGEQQFRLLADNAPVMIWRADTTKACDFFNKPWLDFTGRGMDQELGFGWAEGVHPEDFDRCLAIFTGAFDRRESFSMTYRLRRHDGVYRWLLDNGRPYQDAAGRFAGYFGSCVDVTEMKRALDDKDVLLREVHHRVRNNMQLITALLDMQAQGAAEQETRDRLSEAAGRIRSIALVQEQLHGADTVSGVDLGDYLRSLVTAVAGLRGRLAVEVDADPLPLPLDRAVPIGLIVNELLTNALKHAFPDGRPGTIRVEARRDAQGAVAILVADDGIGLADAMLEERPRSLGYRLIRRLAVQAAATVDLDPGSGRGTRHRIRLSPVNAPDACGV
ncbi:sensor histidine kinase [Azospirillum thermophilum]|uniref:histidine kinase n=1 Tax=Azospirillum thermophilum TaxID=2202148 RepID=A0A2S2CQA1_9PROT|nr:histidine kinase dimerization/phosphoacceptor domain -containing protein [Azospirillum thermophilum]AWK86656.1 histidine kinase [Azospirillum thermophilum]